MARFTFGGVIDQLVVAPDAALGGALKAAPGSTLPTLYNKPVTDITRVVVTDYLVDSNGDGTFDQAATSITVDSSGYPRYFQGPDNLATLYDLAGRSYIANDAFAGAGGVPPASTTVSGVIEIATLTEVGTGTDTTRAVTPQGVEARVDTHEAQTNPHSVYGADIATLQSVQLTKADLVGGEIPLDQIPKSASATADTIAQRRPNAGLAVGPAGQDDEAVPLLQAVTLFGAEAVGADVRHRKLQPTDFPLSNNSATTLAEIPGMRITDGASGDQWRAEYAIKYRASLAAGIKIQVKVSSATVTNLLANPSFETDVANWTKTTGPFTAPTRETSAGAHVGTAAMRLLATGIGTMNVVSELIPAAPGSVWTAGAWAKLGVGLAGNFRVAIQDIAADGTTVLITDQGPIITPNSGAWTQAITDIGGHTAVSNTAFVRARVNYAASASGDSVFVDAVQLEPSTPLPAYGSTGGSGSTSLDIDGWWKGLATSATSSNDYSRVSTVRSAVSDLASTFGGLGTGVDAQLVGSLFIEIGGTGLTGQVIELEFCQKTLDAGNPTAIVAGNSTLVKLP